MSQISGQYYDMPFSQHIFGDNWYTISYSFFSVLYSFRFKGQQLVQLVKEVPQRRQVSEHSLHVCQAGCWWCFLHHAHSLRPFLVALKKDKGEEKRLGGAWLDWKRKQWPHPSRLFEKKVPFLSLKRKKRDWSTHYPLLCNIDFCNVISTVIEFY